MYTRIRNQIRLELGEINVQGTVEPQTRCNGRYYLSNQPIKIRITRSIDIQVSSAQLVNGLRITYIIVEEQATSLLECDIWRIDERYSRELYFTRYIQWDTQAF